MAWHEKERGLEGRGVEILLWGHQRVTRVIRSWGVPVTLEPFIVGTWRIDAKQICCHCEQNHDRCFWLSPCKLSALWPEMLERRHDNITMNYIRLWVKNWVLWLNILCRGQTQIIEKQCRFLAVTFWAHTHMAPVFAFLRGLPLSSCTESLNHRCTKVVSFWDDMFWPVQPQLTADRC